MSRRARIVREGFVRAYDSHPRTLPIRGAVLDVDRRVDVLAGALADTLEVLDAVEVKVGEIEHRLPQMPVMTEADLGVAL